MQEFETMLTGGHPNSLGNTLKVVEIILNNPKRLADLIDTYNSKDEVVRLRVSNALKRITKSNPEWVVPFLDIIIYKISKINQASTQWTIAQVLLSSTKFLTAKQKADSIELLQNNLENNKDWIVINQTMQTLFEWSKTDESLKTWLMPKLKIFAKDSHKSIAGRASRYLGELP